MATSVILPSRSIIQVEDRSSCADNVVALSNKTCLSLPPPCMNAYSLLVELEISHSGYIL